MLWSGLIESQDTLKVIEDRALIVSPEGDTIFTYGLESHFVVEKMFEEKDLLVQEIINGYETERAHIKRQVTQDSIITAQKNKIINLELSSKTIEKRLNDCEDSQEIAELDINKANKTIKDQNKQIKLLRVWNRVKNVLVSTLVGVVLYLSFF